MQVRAANQLRFEEFDLDVGCRTLRRAGRTLDLRPRSFDVLVYLAEAAGRPVGKEEILAAVWPDVVVSEESLTRCVSDIRQVLGEHGQHIIKTLPRRGYLFAAPVEPVPASSAASPAAGAGSVSPASGAALPPLPGRANGMVSGEPESSHREPVKAALPRAGAEVVAWPALHTDRVHAFRPKLTPLRLAIAVAVAAVAILLTWAFRPWTVTGRSDAAKAPGLSIVVLPLSVIGGGDEQAYFADGLAEDLTTDLSAIPGSFVIARGSANRYRGQTLDARRIGEELGVRYAVEGSVQPVGGPVRLNLRLVDTETGREIWAERMEGQREDLPALQTRIVGSIARALNLKMVAAEAERARRTALANPDAQDLVWQAWSAIERKTPASMSQARELLQRAVALEPGSATAWGLLSDVYTNDLLARSVPVKGAQHDEWVARAEQAAKRAYEADPGNLFALGAMGTVLQVRGKAEDSLAMLLHQVEVNRNYAPGWHRISYTYALLGKTEEAIDAGAKAIALSPRDGRLYSFLVVMAACHLYLGHDAQALDFAKRSTRERPDYAIGQAWLAAAAALNGDVATARGAIEQFRRLQPGYTIETFRSEPWLGNERLARQRERFYRGLALAGLPE